MEESRKVYCWLVRDRNAAVVCSSMWADTMGEECYCGNQVWHSWSLFMFQLAKDDCLRSQIATLNGKRGTHLKYLPYAFTENGIAMLSSVLRSETAINVNIRIMRAFHCHAPFCVRSCRACSACWRYWIETADLFSTIIFVGLKKLQ